MAGKVVRACYDDISLRCNHTSLVCLPWHALSGVRNGSLKKAARYKGEKPPRPDLPEREGLERTSRRFVVKFLLAIMNSRTASDYLQSIRRSNTDLYPDDWKHLPIPDVPPANQAPIVALVEKILAAKRADKSADISLLEAEIDDLVNELYGIAADETAGELEQKTREDICLTV